MRDKVPKRIETEILFLNRHTCCICHDDDKDVQIHHIDGNNSNNRIPNLAVLCLNCHSKVTGTRGLGKSYSTVEVKRYKNEWEKKIKSEFGLPSAKRAKPIPRIEKQLFIFEAKRLIYEMLCAQDSNRLLMSRNFQNLWNLSILEGLQKEIIEHLQFAFTITSIQEVNKPIELANALPQFFVYLVGPSEVKMAASDERNVVAAIETIEYSHNLSVEQNKNYRMLGAFKDSLRDFILMAITYKNVKIFRKALKVLKEIGESSTTIYYKKDRKMPRLRREVDYLLQDIKKELKRENLCWKV